MILTGRFFVSLGVLVIVGFPGTTCITNEEQKILNWKAPPGMQKLLPYQLSGFDRDGSPVWTVPFGDWNIRGFLETGDPKKAADNFDKYIEQLMLRFSLSPKKYETPLDEWTVIGNMEGYSMLQLAHVPTIQRSLEGTRTYATYANKYNNFKKAICVNTNFVWVSMLRILRPVFGQVFEKIEVLGTNKGSWRPALLKEIQKDQLPVWLGGSANHKPIEEYS